MKADVLETNFRLKGKRGNLHVVWEEPPSLKSTAPGPAVRIALKNVLDAPPAEVALALESEAGLPASLRVQLESGEHQPNAPNNGKRDWQGVLNTGIKSLAEFEGCAKILLIYCE